MSNPGSFPFIGVRKIKLPILVILKVFLTIAIKDFVMTSRSTRSLKIGCFFDHLIPHARIIPNNTEDSLLYEIHNVIEKGELMET
jgi:hypothetical protein